MPGGRYEITKNSDGTCFFRLLTISGKPVVHSGIYNGIAVCKKGIASLRINSDAPIDDKTEKKGDTEKELKCPKIEIYSEKNSAGNGYGSFNFAVRARNGTVIACGEGYGTKNRCLEAVQSLRYIAFSAEVYK